MGEYRHMGTFRTSDLRVLNELGSTGYAQVLRDKANSAWGYAAMIVEPDGRLIIITAPIQLEECAVGSRIELEFGPEHGEAADEAWAALQLELAKT